MWKNQMFYSPFSYGQYIDHSNKIYTVIDLDSIVGHNETQLSYEWRSTNINPATNQTYITQDFKMNSKYTDSPMSSKGWAFFPSLLAFVVFFVFISVFGRDRPNKDRKHGERLKKRRKGQLDKFSWRGIKGTIRNSLRRNPHASPSNIRPQDST